MRRFGNAGTATLLAARDDAVRKKAACGDCAACARGPACGGGGATVRRAGEGGAAVAKAPPDCVPSDESISSLDQHWTFRFFVNRDDLKPGEAARFATTLVRIPAGSALRVHGFASEDGPPAFNLALSCRRAKKIAAMLRSARPDCPVAPPLMHGEAGTARDRGEWRSVLVEWVQPTAPVGPATEECGKHLGSCEFYRCRERRHPCGAGGYYQGYGLKYCLRFSALATLLSPAGRAWVAKTLRCLQEHLHRKVPYDMPCPEAWRSAFNSHPGCYIAGGICVLGPSDWSKIVSTIDTKDLEMKQALITSLGCMGNYVPMLFPATSLGAGGGLRGLMERDRQRARQRMTAP
jgi:hypothetical protein